MLQLAADTAKVMDPKALVDYINAGGVLALGILFIVAGSRQLWVWGWTYKAQGSDKDKQLADKQKQLDDANAELKRMRAVFEDRVLPALIAYTDVTQDLVFRERQRRDNEAHQ